MNYRTIKDSAQPPENITIEQAREAVRTIRVKRLYSSGKDTDPKVPYQKPKSGAKTLRAKEG